MTSSTFLILAVSAVLSVPGMQALHAEAITVSSQPLWTNTGILLNPHDTVTIHDASGSWSIGSGYWGGPNGISADPVWEANAWIINGDVGNLIGFVGTVSNLNMPEALPQDDAGLFSIGTQTVNLSGVSGELWLGFNDDWTGYDISDNVGSVVAQVDVVPEPASLSLLAIGVTALLSRRPR